MKKWSVIVPILLVLLVFGGFYFAQTNVKERGVVQGRVSEIQIRDQKIRAEIVDTESTRQKGLSGRTALAPGHGMLFVFDKDGFPAFWMKDMLFAIDIIWISSDLRVVHIEKNVSPQTYPQSFIPQSPSRYVLEAQAGFSDEFNVRTGDTIEVSGL